MSDSAAPPLGSNAAASNSGPVMAVAAVFLEPAELPPPRNRPTRSSREPVESVETVERALEQLEPTEPPSPSS